MNFTHFSCITNISTEKFTYLSERLAEQKGEQVCNADAMHQPAYSLYGKIFSKQSQFCLKLISIFSLSKQVTHSTHIQKQAANSIPAFFTGHQGGVYCYCYCYCYYYYYYYYCFMVIIPDNLC